MAIVKHGSLSILLDVLSFFLVTTDLYGEPRLTKLAKQARRVVFWIWHWQKSGGVAALVGTVAIVGIWGGGFGFALVHIFSQGLFNVVYQKHSGSWLETVLWWIFVFSFFGPIVLGFMLELAVTLLVRIKLTGWMLGAGTLVFLCARYIEFTELPD